MRLTITKRYTFESAHQLPWHDGKCARLHGHSYVLDVSVSGEIRYDSGAPDSGMVLDFARVSDVVKPIVNDLLDHRSLNDLVQNPTAERIVEWLVYQLNPAFAAYGVDLVRVRLYETATGWVEWSE